MKFRYGVAVRMLFCFCVLFSFATLSDGNAQTLKARLSITSTAPARIKIEAQFPSATDRLSFRNTYAGVLGLGERIETVAGIRENGERVRSGQLAPGEFRVAEKLSRFTYEVNLAGTLRPADLSHVSSLDSDRGVLMMADLLPQTTEGSAKFSAAVIEFQLPTGWTVTSNTKRATFQFLADNPEAAVFLVGSRVHEKQSRLATTSFSIITSGDWPISDKDVTKIAAEILKQYSRITHFNLKPGAVVMLVPYPGGAGPDHWSAETRGNVVVLVLGRQASRKQVLARLGIVLSHELFHLWVPNSLELAGDYDWFFEGFTLYRALQTDLRLGLISFADALETIARVYDSYLSTNDRDRLSLIEASERRWTTSASLVYDKGMLVAFVYDLLLRKLTDCQASLDDVYEDLFRLPATGQGSGNETIINLLTKREELKSFGRDYVEKAAEINLGAVLPAFGIQMRNSASGATQLLLARDLSPSQRKLLGCIGYRR